MTATLAYCSYDIDRFGKDNNAYHCELGYNMYYMRGFSPKFPQVYPLTISEKQWSEDPTPTTYHIEIDGPSHSPRDWFEVYVSNRKSGGDRHDWGNKLLFEYSSAQHEVDISDTLYASSERVKVAAGVALYHFLSSQASAEVDRFSGWMDIWSRVISSEQPVVKLKEYGITARSWAIAGH